MLSARVEVRSWRRPDLSRPHDVERVAGVPAPVISDRLAGRQAAPVALRAGVDQKAGEIVPAGVIDRVAHL